MYILFLFLSCRSIPDAPKSLDLLGSYIFENFDQDNPQYLQQGVSNLDIWVSENREAVLEGYRIENLSQVAISELGMSDDTILENLLGAAVATDVQNTLDVFLPTILKTDPMELSPDAYGYFHQDWNGNIDCFLQKECDLLTYIPEGLLLFPLGLEIESTVSGQFRWVHVDDMSYVVQRRWMVEPGKSNKDWMQIDQDYALAIFIPMSDGLRIVDLEWVVTYLGDMPVPEDFVLKLAIEAMQDSRTDVDSYIDQSQ